MFYMKMIKAFIVTLLCIVVIVIPSFAQTNNSGERIADFQQSTVINTDGTIDITEKIVYDFGNEQRHGIFRKIPYTKLNKEGKSIVIVTHDTSLVKHATRVIELKDGKVLKEYTTRSKK